MNLVLAGLSHHTAPVELRECLAVVDQAPDQTLTRLLELKLVKEGFFVSTCNRVEFLLVAEPGAEEDRVTSDLRSFIAQTGDLAEPTLGTSLYLKTGREAVRHLFRVASSLDSMVVGEPQILG